AKFYFGLIDVSSDSAHGRRIFQGALLIYLNFSYILLRLLSQRIALRAFFAGFEGKRGATRGKRPWVFSPRAFRAEALDRTHSRSALSEQTSGAPIKIKSIN
ncbi:MAG: hypothetical protein IKC51_08175, partial [Myxococcaceae bacterium]|nr:hypothetical protein [Myxococcaceae bacterium]